MKTLLWNHISQGSHARMQPWLDALILDEQGETLTVTFPHSFFETWFLQHKKALFEDALSHVYPQKYRAIRYGTHEEPLSPATKKPVAETPKPSDTASTYSFATFLYNDKNTFPLSVLETIARQRPGSCFSPVLLSGACGSGKTHLLHALANACRTNTHNVYVCRRVQDLAKNPLIQHPHLFWDEYQGLFIDDLQDLAGDLALQTRLIHCIDLCPANRQLFFTILGDFSHLTNIQERLTTRLSAGLLLDLALPDIDVRLRFIQQMCEKSQIAIAQKHMLLLAQHARGFRQLRGTLVKIMALASMHNRAIAQSDIERVLNTASAERILDSREIMEVVAQKMHVTIAEILGKQRKTHLVLARQIAMYLCRAKLGLSYPELGKVFGDKDHSTVIYAIKKIEALLANDPSMHTLVDELDRML
ncbi:MAG: hypothetical protein IJS54_01290 [Desulfovibrio sp.]|nr:hypothetical protein [Desulfovibrio sp.]